MHRRTNGPAAEDYDTLTRAWRTAIGPIHPDDPDIGRAAR